MLQLQGFLDFRLVCHQNPNTLKMYLLFHHIQFFFLFTYYQILYCKQFFSLAGISLMLLKTSLKKPGFVFIVEVQLAIEDGFGRLRIVLKIYT